MSTPITIFGSTEHLSGDNLPPRIENLNDKVITSESILSVNPDETVNANPVSAYGKTLLDTTSLADLRTQILENTNEEAIRLLADGNNEINFYTGGTGASNLKLQIKDSSIEVKNGASLSTFDVTVDPNRSFIASYVGSDTGNNLNLRYGASVYQQFNASGIEINQNVVMANNKFLKMKIEDSDARVLLESLGKRQVCLYSYEANNSGMLVQADANDILAINNYKNSIASYRPICINRSDTTYVVMGASINPTSISPVNFVSNGVSVFCNGASPLLHISSSNIKPYTSIIPNGVNAEDLGNATNYFGQTHTNKVDVKSDMFMNIFGSSNLRNTGFFFRSGFGSGSGIQDNMCIRGHNAGGANDGLMISAYGGVSVNCGLIGVSNDNGLDGSGNRAMLINTTINNHVNMLPSADGTLNIGSTLLKFSNLYCNNVRAHTSLYTDNIRAYSASPIHYHNTDVTFDNDQSISVDRVYSSATNRDLYLGCGASDIKMRFYNGALGETETLANIVPPSNGQNAIGTSSRKFAQVNALAITATTQVNTSVISYTDVVNEEVLVNGHFRPATDNTRQLGGNSYRWNEIFCTNTTINTSDRNMKKDIQPITDALQFVRKLKPVQYKWKENSHGRIHTGFIAQDVLEANPLGLGDNWSGYVDTGNGLGLRYAEFISVITQGIKELDSKVSKLQKSSVIIHEDGETKSDVNYHTDTSELYERIEALEQQIEEMGETIGENIVQNVIEIQSDDDRTELTEELERLSRKNDKLEETLTNNDAVIQELVNKINVLENRLKQKQDEETEESEGGINMVEMLQNRNYEMEQRMNKLEKQNKKLTSNLNKILKQLKNDTN